MSNLHTLADVMEWTGGAPLVRSLFREEGMIHPELRWTPIKITNQLRYKTLWDASPYGKSPAEFLDQNGKHDFDAMGLGGIFRPINGFARKCGKPEYEFRTVETYKADCFISMDECLPEEFEFQNRSNDSIQSVIGDYEEAVVRHEINRLMYSHAGRFWYGTGVDGSDTDARHGYLGLYQTYRYGVSTAAGIEDPTNPNDVGTPGQHFSVWLIKRSLREDQGLHYVFNQDLASINLNEWTKTLVQDPNDPNKCRWDIVNNMHHRAGFVNLSKYNAIRIYGFTNPLGSNPITDDVGYLLRSKLPKTINLDEYYAWMPGCGSFYLRESRNNADCCTVTRTVDGTPITFPNNWAGWPIIETDWLTESED